MTNLEQAQGVFEQYKDIAIFASKDNSEALEAANYLLHGLKKLSKNATFLPVEDVPPHASNYSPSNQAKADFLISIKEGGAKLSQLFYEKTNSGLNLFLKTDGQEIKQGDIDLRPLKPSRLLVVIGINKKEQSPLLPKRENDFSMYINNQEKSACLGDINIIETGRGLTEIVFEIVKTLSRPYFIQKIEQEAQTKFIANSERYVFETALSNLQYNQKNSLLSTTLSHADLIKNNASPKDIKLSLAELTSEIFSFCGFLLLWEQNSSPLKVHGIFYSPNNRANVEKLALNFSGQQNNKAAIFNTQENNFKTAQEKINSLLNN
ncbi:MAG: hypothetical protein PHE77_01900 [Candidatus Pacebacteria bacterium]|nr:hypothetical protein [Candidatus Paceibacterota bacterium]